MGSACFAAGTSHSRLSCPDGTRHTLCYLHGARKPHRILAEEKPIWYLDIHHF